MYEIITLGETMVVCYPSEPIELRDAHTLQISIGGAESNLAMALSLLGHNVSFISRVGNDPFGERIRATLRQAGVDTSYLFTDTSAPTGVFFRTWLPDGRRSVFYYRSGSAASRLAPTDLDPAAFVGARLLHLSGITPALSASCAATIVRAIDLAHEAGAQVSFDPNYRAALWDPVTASQALLPLMARSDVLLLGHEDSQAILGLDDAALVLARGRELGARLVVFKEAGRGATAQVGETCVSVPAEMVAAAVDPVGAGDAFNAGFLSGWLRGATLLDALALGAHLGALAVAHVGDYVEHL